MKRKRVTELFPFLIPLRTKQRKFCFYLGMRLDKNTYCKARLEGALPYVAFEDSSQLYNTETGFDMVYQENKVFNLKLAAKELNGLLIRPGETFSFSQAIRYADRHTPYKEGLTVVNGHLTSAPGGGMCQISNLLFWLFLHTPLTIVERHGHASKDFPDPPSNLPTGVDATISEGWLDLKVKNDTNRTYQIFLSFDSHHLFGRLLCSEEDACLYQIQNGKISYIRQDKEIIQLADIIQTRIDRGSGQPVESRRLYQNKCRIGYPLSSNINIAEKG